MKKLRLNIKLLLFGCLQSVNTNFRNRLVERMEFEDFFRFDMGLLEVTSSAMGVKQSCPLSPALSAVHVDQVSKLRDRRGGNAAAL